MTVDELSEVAARLAALRQGFPDRLPPEVAAELGALLRLGLKAADRDRDQPITPAAGGAA